MHELLMRWDRLEGRLEDPSKRPAGSVPVEALIPAHPIAPPPSDGEPGDAWADGAARAGGELSGLRGR